MSTREEEMHARQREEGAQFEQLDYFKRIAEALELIARPGQSVPVTAVADEPVHSGHKGGEFLKLMKKQFEARFADSSIEWSAVNRLITTLFNMAGRFTKSADGCTEEDVLWLYGVLWTSLQNGFAKELSDMRK